ncbi:hypothetical protein ALCH109712_08595 [Alkalicoccus chagannorensis]
MPTHELIAFFWYQARHYSNSRPQISAWAEKKARNLSQK